MPSAFQVNTTEEQQNTERCQGRRFGVLLLTLSMYLPTGGANHRKL